MPRLQAQRLSRSGVSAFWVVSTASPRFPYCLIVFQSRENGYSIFAEQPLRQFVQKFALNFVESAYLQIGQNYLKY
jgi:hypothetical protein